MSRYHLDLEGERERERQTDRQTIPMKSGPTLMVRSRLSPIVADVMGKPALLISMVISGSTTSSMVAIVDNESYSGKEVLLKVKKKKTEISYELCTRWRRLYASPWRTEPIMISPNYGSIKSVVSNN